VIVGLGRGMALYREPSILTFVLMVIQRS